MPICTDAPPNDDSPSEDGTNVGVVRGNAFDAPRFEHAVSELLAASGLAARDPHLKKTPQRVRELWQHRLLGGYDTDLTKVLGDGFEDPRKDMVTIAGIAIHGVCPHHLVPFLGVAHVAYLPGGRLHGFGRVARLVDALANRFTYQEWLTRDIVNAMVEYGHAEGAAVVVEAEQLCLLLGENRRGQERVRTQAFAGTFCDAPAARQEFLAGLPAPRR